jgi:hypothetical protein
MTFAYLRPCGGAAANAMFGPGTYVHFTIVAVTVTLDRNHAKAKCDGEQNTSQCGNKGGDNTVYGVQG